MSAESAWLGNTLISTHKEVLPKLVKLMKDKEILFFLIKRQTVDLKLN